MYTKYFSFPGKWGVSICGPVHTRLLCSLLDETPSSEDFQDIVFPWNTRNSLQPQHYLIFYILFKVTVINDQNLTIIMNLLVNMWLTTSHFQNKHLISKEKLQTDYFAVLWRKTKEALWDQWEKTIVIVRVFIIVCNKFVSKDYKSFMYIFTWSTH